MTDSIDGAASRKCAMLIINPISGTGNKKNVPEMVAGRLKEFGFDLDVRFTGGRGDATTLAAEPRQRVTGVSLPVAVTAL